MAETWLNVKYELYKTTLNKLDETANSILRILGFLIPLGFGMITALQYVIEVPKISLWISWVGFFLLGISLISTSFVIFLTPLRIGQLSKPPEISSAWEKRKKQKSSYLLIAYFFLIIGLLMQLVAMLTTLL